METNREQPIIGLPIDVEKPLECLTIMDDQKSLIDYAILAELELDGDSVLYLALVKHAHVKEPNSEVLLVKYDAENSTVTDIDDDQIWNKLFNKLQETGKGA